ncbi:MAG: glycoside hydrolase family 28 protein [Acidobacteriaceae bacterium]
MKPAIHRSLDFRKYTRFAMIGLGLLACGALSSHAATMCDPHTYGAKADGKTVDTHALQAAIDACAEKGGGTVELAAGTYLSAPLTLKSHVHLHLEKGATLLGTQNLDDYPIRKDAPWRRIALLHADGQTDLAITGEGTIDGAGQFWWEKAREHRIAGDTSGSAGFARPLLFDLVKSNHIDIEGISIRNSPMYNITLFQCSDITIRNVDIKNPQHAPNTDGIDPFYSQHIRISHVHIDTGDDDIAIKSGLVERGEPNIASSDITITDSTFLHGHGLSIGSEVAGGVHDVVVDHVTFDGTDAGVRVKSNRTRGNDIYNLKYSNLTMKDVKVPILITEYYPRIPATDTAQPMAEHTPRFRDITIQNLTATGAKVAATIAGLPESPIKNLVLENVNVSAETGATIQNANIVMKNVVFKPLSGPPMQIRANVHIVNEK